MAGIIYRLIRRGRKQWRLGAPLIFILMLIRLSPSALAGVESAPAESILEQQVEALQVQDTPIEDVLRMLAEQNDLNLIIGPDSMGSVTLRFARVSLRAALDAILRAKGYQYQLYDNIMLITLPDSLERRRGLGVETRLFKLKYTDARSIKATIDTARVLSPWGYCTVYSRAVNVEAAKAAGIKPGLAFIQGEQYTLVEQAGVGSIPLQTRSDILLITDKPHVLDKLATLIESLDFASRQIAIEVRFVETLLDNQHQAGIDWQKLLQVEGQYKGKTNWKLGSEPLAFSGTGGGVIETGSLPTTRFNVVLDMMLQDKRSKLLSQPSITTIDHQPATISVGITTWIEERTGSAATGDVQITYKERQVPIELIVVPHILYGDRILLEMRPRVEEITGYQEGAGGLQLPLITSRSADARVEVKNGETGVIGGMIKERISRTVKKVWLLGSLPLVGNLFRHELETNERTDLSIFITPTIIERESEPGESQAEVAKPVSSPKPAPKPAPQPAPTQTEPPKETPEPAKAETSGATDMHAYFPLSVGARWQYTWNRKDGSQWSSGFAVADQDGDRMLVNESIPDGPNQSEARTGYLWNDTGMLNTYRTNLGGDSIAYDPPRLVLPAEMADGQVYENRYGWISFDSQRRKLDSKQVTQRQRLIGRFAVNSALGKFSNCLAVETVWFDSNAPNADPKRKVVWYAPDVGPVKVEQDIPIGAPTLKGATSALISER